MIVLQLVISCGLDGYISIPGRDQDLLFATMFISTLGPIQHLIQWVPATVSPGLNSQGVKLSTHFNSVLR